MVIAKEYNLYSSHTKSFTLCANAGFTLERWVDHKKKPLVCLFWQVALQSLLDKQRYAFKSKHAQLCHTVASIHHRTQRDRVPKQRRWLVPLSRHIQDNVGRLKTLSCCDPATGSTIDVSSLVCLTTLRATVCRLKCVCAAINPWLTTQPNAVVCWARTRPARHGRKCRCVFACGGFKTVPILLSKVAFQQNSNYCHPLNRPWC